MAAYEIPGFRFTLPAGQDFTGKRFRFVKCDGSGNAILTAAATDIPVGVAQDEPNVIGAPLAVYGSGITKVIAGAAIVAGAPVSSDATGAAITATAGKFIAGIALTTAGAAGEQVSVLFQPAGISA